jgi:hypothetical protein
MRKKYQTSELPIETPNYPVEETVIRGRFINRVNKVRSYILDRVVIRRKELPDNVRFLESHEKENEQRYSD